MLEAIFLLWVVTEEEDGHLLMHLTTVLYMHDPTVYQLERFRLAELTATQEEDLKLYGKTELGGDHLF